MTADERWQPRRVLLPAIAAAAVLLMSFHQVVSGSVRHADARRQASEQHLQALRLCDQEPDSARRVLCISRADTQADPLAGGLHAAIAAQATSARWQP